MDLDENLKRKENKVQTDWMSCGELVDRKRAICQKAERSGDSIKSVVGQTRALPTTTMYFHSDKDCF